jgi:hypothetical protein
MGTRAMRFRKGHPVGDLNGISSAQTFSVTIHSNFTGRI